MNNFSYCSCFKKEEEYELSDANEEMEQMIVDGKLLKYKFNIDVHEEYGKVVYTFFVTDKALKQIYEKKNNSF